MPHLISDFEKNYVSLEDKDSLIIFLKTECGLDFTDYSEASVRRRIAKILSELKISNVSHYIDYLREEEGAIEEFIEKFTVNVTEMYRDPFFYKVLVKKVFSTWHNLEEIKVWSAGCSTGEEVLSLAIFLAENNLLYKTKILATDLSPSVLKKARSRTYDLKHLASYQDSYKDAGGTDQLETYYERKNQSGIFKEFLYKNIEFDTHNLTTELYKEGFDLIICRNVLIYFNPKLQDKVIGQFTNSLKLGGHLVLGSKESVIFYQERNKLKELESEAKIYQRLG